ncbi:MAG: hypothetical protein OXP08_00325, partial [bacterium]|nr:hypothetical protein [bacterium]
MTAAGALVWAAVALWAALGAYTSVTDLREGIIPGRWVWRAGFAVAALLGAAAVLSGDPLRLAGAFATAAGVGLAVQVGAPPVGPPRHRRRRGAGPGGDLPHRARRHRLRRRAP